MRHEWQAQRFGRPVLYGLTSLTMSDNEPVDASMSGSPCALSVIDHATLAFEILRLAGVVQGQDKLVKETARANEKLAEENKRLRTLLPVFKASRPEDEPKAKALTQLYEHWVLRETE